MKPVYIFIVLLLTILTISSKSYAQDDFPILEGPYLGQPPPGSIAEVFAPGIVSTKYFEAFGVFTPDLKEFYFLRGGGKYKKHTLFVIQESSGTLSPIVSQNRFERLVGRRILGAGQILMT